jgi:hypothetical protein
MDGPSRRGFLKALGVSPSLTLVAEPFAAQRDTVAESTAGKFTPVELTPYCNTSVADFGTRQPPAGTAEAGAEPVDFARIPRGNQTFRGIPFLLGRQGAGAKTWVAVATHRRAWGASAVEIRLGHKARQLCFAHFCDWDATPQPAPIETVENLAAHLGDVVLTYEDGGEQRTPVRRRFEVQTPLIPLGQWCFAAMPHQRHEPTRLTDPLRGGMGWGLLQTGVRSEALTGPIVWLWALPSSRPDEVIRSVRFESRSEAAWVVCGLTLCNASSHPLRYEPRTVYRLTLPDASATARDRWKIEVDLGVVVRSYPLRAFQPDAWQSAPLRGFGDRSGTPWDMTHLYLEIAASRGATLTLRDTEAAKVYRFELDAVTPGQELEASAGGLRVSAIERGKVWVHGRVLDRATGRPTPVRLAFRSAEGRYLPPYGHRAEIDTGWFQDYGADLRLAESSFAYVDGTFQIELPVGVVYAELSKGFEYEPVRQKLEIQPGQRELTLDITRRENLRSKGWVTADTHVHFLSPSTALLEAQAEGLNVINLLAAQLGDLFTNVGDIPAGPLVSPDGESVVWVGTENRQHMLGHIGLLAVRGEPVFPMSSAGPDESYLGDPLRSSLAEWAAVARSRDGLAIAAHFGVPLGEIAADVVGGHIDAVELLPRRHDFNEFRFIEWYRYLNCGYRLALVGGTDKMGAGFPVGANRTYSYLGGREFSYSNWAAAVRRGNTFATTGPLLLFEVDGHIPGSEIRFGVGGGTVEVSAEASSSAPLHHLEIVCNGRVVASRTEASGSRSLSLRERVRLSGPGWLAARCGSRLPSAPFGLVAHTSPVYVAVPDQEVFSAPIAEYLLNLVEGAELWVDTLATRPDPASLARTRQVFEHARAHLLGRLHRHR